MQQSSYETGLLVSSKVGCVGIDTTLCTIFGLVKLIQFNNLKYQSRFATLDCLASSLLRFAGWLTRRCPGLEASAAVLFSVLKHLFNMIDKCTVLDTSAIIQAKGICY